MIGQDPPDGKPIETEYCGTRARYDADADVLYVGLERVPAQSIETPLTVLVRRAYEDGRIVGMTVVDFKAQIEEREDG